MISLLLLQYQFAFPMLVILDNCMLVASAHSFAEPFQVRVSSMCVAQVRQAKRGKLPFLELPTSKAP
jgi:hypothetical protein